jgi:mono/diheme cytochrome c family protein
MRRINYLVAILFLTGAIVITACSDSSDTSSTGTETTSSNGNEIHGDLVKPEDVQLTTPLNQEWVAQGKNIYDVKCQSCHKLTDERIVGPGWAGLTQKREPHWIMNMITNVDIMLESDPEAQKLLEQCLVRMPNQNISKEESRAILEYMRHNDGVQ